jgi:hypothetical protein
MWRVPHQAFAYVGYNVDNCVKLRITFFKFVDNRNRFYGFRTGPKDQEDVMHRLYFPLILRPSIKSDGEPKAP